MDNIKEKLVGLLSKVQNCGVLQGDHVLHVTHPSNETVANHLISNGVTIQKWISVEEAFPDAHKRVIVHYSDGKIDTGFRLRYAGEFSLESVYGKVTHWMPLPEPPKGE